MKTTTLTAAVLLTAFATGTSTLGVGAVREGDGGTPWDRSPLPGPERRAAAERLAEAIRFPTVSRDDAAGAENGAWYGLHAFLSRAFPAVHGALRRETVGGLSLLYTWEGSDPALKPILLSAHLDVVPVATESERDWTHPPFAGRIADGYVWGRGALDDKAAVLGVLEAVELLLEEGFRPARTVYLAFGHDEERGGIEGAARIARLLRARGVALEYVLDEGLFVADGLIPGVARPVALIGVAEKGRATLELVARGPDGHASTPSARGAIGALARAVQRVEERPMPAAVRSPVRELFEALAPEMSFGRRVLFSHLGLFAPLVSRVLARSRTTNAVVRTTLAITMVQAGSKTNVLPGVARATVDARILPGDSVAAVVDHVRRAIGDREIEIRVLGATAPSPVAPVTGTGFRTLAVTVGQVFPGAVVVPGLLVAGTDSKHYVTLTDAVYRFRPFQLTPGDVCRIHGVDERIGVDDHARAIAVYGQFLYRAASAPRSISPVTPGRGTSEPGPRGAAARGGRQGKG